MEAERADKGGKKFVLIASPFVWTGKVAPVHHLIPLSCVLPGFRLSFRDLRVSQVSPHRHRDGSCRRSLLLEETAGAPKTISAVFVATASADLLFFIGNYFLAAALRHRSCRPCSRGSVAGRSRGCRRWKGMRGPERRRSCQQDGGLQTGWGSSGRD